jgi:hypothetical protein
MIESDRLAERTEDYRMNAGGIAGTDCVHPNRAFLPQSVFA